MNKSDRILLAEALGWTKWDYPMDRSQPYFERPSGAIVALSSFDPFTDANDDYAVLQHVLESQRSGNPVHWAKFKKGMTNQFRKIWMYEIGDYARAYLTVLKDG